MASQLADETLHHILEYALEISDDDFSDVSGMEKSPFARREYSSSDVLLVCKRWMRVATPLLYDTVVLRSTAQAQALAKALKKNPEFAPYLKKLRLEGGFGASVGKIMRAATSLSDFHVSLELSAQDSVRSMCDALPAINPKRLILSSTPISSSTTSFVVVEALRAAAPTWTALTTTELPTIAVLCLCRVTTLAAGMPGLQELWIKEYDTRFVHRDLESMLRDFVPSTIRVIRIEANTLSALESLRRNAQELSQYGHNIIPHLKAVPSSVIRCAADSDSFGNNTNPLHHAPPHVQEKVWGHVLESALAIDDIPGYYSRKHDPLTSSTNAPRGLGPTNIKALRYMAVCKLFREICTRIAVRHMLIGTNDTETGFLRLLERHPQLSLEVRSLLREPIVIQRGLAECLTRLPNLTTLRCHVWPSDLPVLRAFSARATLVELDVVLLPLDADRHELVLSCPSLRRLRVSFVDRKPLPQRMFNLDFPSLEELDLPDDDPSWIVNILPQSQIPRLRILRIASLSPNAIEDLLSAYGQGCEEVVVHTRHLDCSLRLCPNVKTMVLVGTLETLSLDAVARESPHTKLERMRFTGLASQGYPRRFAKLVADSATAFFAALSPATFPMLREIVVERISWPTTPREIASDPAVKWADSSIAKGIQLLDKTGKAWRPRLKTAGARRG